MKNEAVTNTHSKCQGGKMIMVLTTRRYVVIYPKIYFKSALTRTNDMIFMQDKIGQWLEENFQKGMIVFIISYNGHSKSYPKLLNIYWDNFICNISHFWQSQNEAVV
jgi:hypothetical protein